MLAGMLVLFSRAATTRRSSLALLISQSLSTRTDNDLVVAIMGPPNAGKSTLFNRFLCKESNRAYRLQSEKGHRKGRSKGRVGSPRSPRNAAIGGAIVSSTPGTTRDRREAIGRIGSVYFRLVDTAGVDTERIEHLNQSRKNYVERKMMEQTLVAVKEADIIFLVVDARTGVTTDVAETARWLRKFSRGKESHVKKQVVVLANKLEGDSWEYDGSPVLENLSELNRIGFGEAIPISAAHSEGLAAIAVVIDNHAKKSAALQDADEIPELPRAEQEKQKPLQVAILGRQNVGKSTLVNALLKKERVITGETPGLTRDSILVPWEWNGRPVQIADTAGIRKVSQRDPNDNIEDMAVQDAMRSMKLADVAVLVLDAEATLLHRQELAIADAVVKEGRSIVVVANKMDLMVDAEYTAQDFATAVQQHVESRLPMLRRTPVVAMSSLTGENVEALMPVVFGSRDRWVRVISTGILNRWLSEVIRAHPPPLQQGKVTRIKYIIQTKGRPPTFLLFCNHDKLPVAYTRFLTRHFQDTFEYYGMEVRIAVKRSAENPYVREKKRGGSGLGGRQARQDRVIKELKATGVPKRKRRRPRNR